MLKETRILARQLKKGDVFKVSFTDALCSFVRREYAYGETYIRVAHSDDTTLIRDHEEVILVEKTMKNKNNKLYTLCLNCVKEGKSGDVLKLSFGIKLPEKEQLRENHARELYFSIIDTVLPQELLADLTLINHKLDALEPDLGNALGRIKRSIYNGENYEK